MLTLWRWIYHAVIAQMSVLN